MNDEARSYLYESLSKKDNSTLYFFPIFFLATGILVLALGVFLIDLLLKLNGFVLVVCSIICRQNAKKAEENRLKLLSLMEKERQAVPT